MFFKLSREERVLLVPNFDSSIRLMTSVTKGGGMEEMTIKPRVFCLSAILLWFCVSNLSGFLLFRSYNFFDIGVYLNPCVTRRLYM